MAQKWGGSDPSVYIAVLESQIFTLQLLHLHVNLQSHAKDINPYICIKIFVWERLLRESWARILTETLKRDITDDFLALNQMNKQNLKKLAKNFQFWFKTKKLRINQ